MKITKSQKDEAQNLKDALRTAISAANKFCTALAEDLQSQHDDKSETWQEGDAGQAVLELIDSLSEEIDIDYVNLDAALEA